MAVNYSLNNGSITGTVSTPTDFKNVLSNLGINNLVQCSLSGKFDGDSVSLLEMFDYCTNLASVDLKKFDTSNV